MQKISPQMGQTVIFRQADDESEVNGHRDHPAIITCVHTDEMVNVKVFFDNGPTADRTSVLHRAIAKKKDKDDEATWDYD